MVDLVLCTSDQVGYVVDLHIQCFPNHFMTSLGRSFVKAYYVAVLTSHSSNIILATNKENVIVGFVAYASNPNKFYKNLYMNPLFILHTWRTLGLLSMLSKFMNRASKKPETTGLEILSLASVMKGVGTKLVRDVIANRSNKGTVSVFTDRNDNTAVLKFYSKLSFYEREFYEINGRAMLHLQYDAQS